MNKYIRLKEELEKTKTGSMKCFGNSMLPVLTNPSTCTYKSQKSYRIGDIVFCKVKGRFIDAHLIKQIGQDGRYLIGNNHGRLNGWTRTIYGKVVKAVGDNSKVIFEVVEGKTETNVTGISSE